MQDRDSQLVLDVLLDREMLIEFENQDTMTHLNEFCSSIVKSGTTTTTKQSMTIDISIRITQIKVYVYDCICFHVFNTMLFSPQHSNGPWIVRSRRVHCFEMRSEKN